MSSRFAGIDVHRDLAQGERRRIRRSYSLESPKDVSDPMDEPPACASPASFGVVDRWHPLAKFLLTPRERERERG